MTDTKHYTTTEADMGKRLDVVLSENLSITRSQIKKLIQRKQLWKQGLVVKKGGELLHPDEQIEMKDIAEEISTPPSQKKNAQPLTVDIIDETKNYIVVNKPAGMIVHPTEAGETDTLVHVLLSKYPELDGIGGRPERPGIVHRLDKDASGALVIARSEEMHAYLKKQFQKRTIKKIYMVLVYGNIETEIGSIDFDIDRGNDGRMVARPNIQGLSLSTMSKIQPGKKSLSEFTVLKRFPRYTLLEVKIKTGRTHQIRVHMFAFGHPVVGDTLYFTKRYIKKNDTPLGRLFLHASTLGFTDLDGEKKQYTAPLPEKLENFLTSLS